MCGISGWLLRESDKYSEHDLKVMSDQMAHRGPDDFDLFVDKEAGIGLAHNRLSIIDLTPRGRQPMISQDGDIVLVFNGEIYNFQELRTTLKRKGYCFQSDSDTEVLLHSFREWGTGCLDKLQGMFAFAAWEPKRHTLFLARDPLGIKPLYYWLPPNQGGLVFASELKAFLSFPGFTPDVDRTALTQFIEFGYTFSPQKTIFKGVSKLEPGHTLTVTPGHVEDPVRYYHPLAAPSGHGVDKKTQEEALFETLQTVVRQHLIADVPVGMLLSGGLDSSLIAALAARNAQISTFCMAFAESKIDERPYARMVSQYIGSVHHEVEIFPEELAQDLEGSVRWFDDLFSDWGLITTRLMYQKCRQRGIKVVIVGEGSDELFGGYSSFRFAHLKRFWEPLDAWLFRLYRNYAGRRYGSQFWQFRKLMREYLEESKGNRFSAIRLFELRNQLPNNYVMKVDKASMAVSVEARVPYLDKRVAELAYQTPEGSLLGNGIEKSILRSLAERYRLLPHQIIHRHKYGNSIAASWMDESQAFREYAREVIMDPGNWTEKLGFRPAMNDYFVDRKVGYGFPYAISILRNLAWKLLILNLWSRSYLKADGKDTAPWWR